MKFTIATTIAEDSSTETNKRQSQNIFEIQSKVQIVILSFNCKSKNQLWILIEMLDPQTIFLNLKSNFQPPPLPPRRKKKAF